MRWKFNLGQKNIVIFYVSREDKNTFYLDDNNLLEQFHEINMAPLIPRFVYFAIIANFPFILKWTEKESSPQLWELILKEVIE